MAAQRDLAGVQTELGKLDESKRALAAAWSRKADARKAALTAAEQIAASANRMIVAQ
jgi:hypothetical protein